MLYLCSSFIAVCVAYRFAQCGAYIYFFAICIYVLQISGVQDWNELAATDAVVYMAIPDGSQQAMRFVWRFGCTLRIFASRGNARTLTHPAND